ncbi:MAG TPA: formate dehydrogenase subunit gamma [Usitatibacter sp.]|jgi:formate dehydrogenase subunit gamma|nr:formate dehydrogenase subunit gamma [Usitatibacter sp.]
MVGSHARRIGALILGAALALPFSTAALAQSPAPPTTAPTKGTETKQATPRVEQPAVESPPGKGQTSTAIPGWNNPPTNWDAVSERPQYASLPGRERNVLIQGAGREWRSLRNGPATQIGGWAIVLVLAAIIVFYLIKGPIRLHGAPTGRLIERFNAVERAAHWTMAASFVTLGLTGIIMFFGKYLILPWLGYTGFSWLTIVSKNLHNFVGPLFIFSIIVGFLIFVKDNFLRSMDWKWMAHFGGMFSGHEMPSGRFNGMEKMWFWGGLTVLGLVMSVTGLILDFPNWNQAREAMQLSNLVHVTAAVIFIVLSFAHIYMGTIGMEGAYRAMRDGYVDEEWAREHHSIWYEEVKQGKRPERILAGRVQPAPGDD